MVKFTCFFGFQKVIVVIYKSYSTFYVMYPNPNGAFPHIFDLHPPKIPKKYLHVVTGNSIRVMGVKHGETTI